MRRKLEHSEMDLVYVLESNMTAASEDSISAAEMNIFEDSLHEEMLQIDGFEDFEEDKSIAKEIFAINCEREEIIELMTLFRSFDNFWADSRFHSICDVDESCFFCRIRSSSLRLRQERTKGPFAIKLNEFVSQIGLYEKIISFDFMHSLQNLDVCIKNTFHLINQFRNHKYFKRSRIAQCCDKSDNQTEYHVNLELSKKENMKELSMQDLVILSVKNLNKQKSCCRWMMN